MQPRAIGSQRKAYQGLTEQKSAEGNAYYMRDSKLAMPATGDMKTPQCQKAVQEETHPSNHTGK